MKEIFKKIEGYPNYEISNFGEVKSLNYKRTGKEKLLHKTVGGTGGYYYVGLSNKGKIKLFAVHQLVAIAFLNHTPDGYKSVINHKDNNPLNNYVDNLEIVTPRYNTQAHKNDPGTALDKRNGKWISKIKINDKSIYLGLFKTKEEALTVYQKACDNIDKFDGNQRNFRNLVNEKSRKFDDIGTTLDKRNGKWVSVININGKAIHLGRFDDKQIAHQIYQKACDNIDKFDGNQRNFRNLINPDGEKDRGVYYDKKNNKWKGCIRINKIKIHLGTFNTKEQAKSLFNFAKDNKHIFDGDKKKFKLFCSKGEV
jgi:hypothetical protein